MSRKNDSAQCKNTVCPAFRIRHIDEERLASATPQENTFLLHAALTPAALLFLRQEKYPLIPWVFQSM